MRIAFFGLPLAALLLHADGHEIVYAGICRKGALGTRRLRRTLAARSGGERTPPREVEILPKLSDPAVVSRVREARPDLLVSWFWTKRIPAALLGLAPMGTVGVHPSLLPRHRGPDPFFWTLREGDREAGVTAHRLAREYDTGALLGSRRIVIDPTWNAWTLAKKLDRPSLALLREVVASFAIGSAPVEVEQDESAATSAPLPSEDDLHLDAKRETAAALLRLVRASAPWPGAWLEIDTPPEGDSEVLVVTRAAVELVVPKALLPGEVYVNDAGRAVLRATDVGLTLLSGRRVGDDQETDLDAAAIASLVARLSGRPRLA